MRPEEEGRGEEAGEEGRPGGGLSGPCGWGPAQKQPLSKETFQTDGGVTHDTRPEHDCFCLVFLSFSTRLEQKEWRGAGAFPRRVLHTDTVTASLHMPCPLPHPVLSHVGAACPWARQELTSGRGTRDSAEARHVQGFPKTDSSQTTALLSPPSTSPSASRKLSMPYTQAQDFSIVPRLLPARPAGSQWP